MDRRARWNPYQPRRYGKPKKKGEDEVKLTENARLSARLQELLDSRKWSRTYRSANGHSQEFLRSLVPSLQQEEGDGE